MTVTTLIGYNFVERQNGIFAVESSNCVTDDLFIEYHDSVGFDTCVYDNNRPSTGALRFITCKTRISSLACLQAEQAVDATPGLEDDQAYHLILAI